MHPKLTLRTFHNRIILFKPVTETSFTTRVQAWFVYDFFIFDTFHVLFVLFLGLDWDVCVIVTVALVDDVLLIVACKFEIVVKLKVVLELWCEKGVYEVLFYQAFYVTVDV